MPSYDTLKKHQSELIRKALKGSLFLAKENALGITTLTTYTAAVTGPPVVPAKIDLTVLPADWEDAGLLTNDGVSAESETTSSDVTSWGYTSPTRSDIITDTTTLSVVMQETKLLTLGIYTGQDMSTIVPTADTGEVAISKPARPRSSYWRGLLLAVDESDSGEVFIGRYFPRIKVTDKAGQTYGGGEEPISYGITLQTYVDDTAGFSERWLFGGDGWKNDLAKIGFPAAA